MTGSVTVKPSLLAAVDVTVKILGTVAAFLLPVAIPAAIEGESLGIAALIAALGIQGISLFPALAAAVLPAVQLAFTTYSFDEEGVTTATQILSKNRKHVSWEKVTALRHRRTVLDVVFGLERIDVVAYGERGATIRLVGLKDAAPLRDRIARHMRETATVEALFRGD